MTIKAGLNRLTEMIKKGDPYSTNIASLFDNGSRQLNSCAGVLAGICLAILLIAYADVKMQILANSSNVPILQPPLHHHFTDDF